MDTANDADYAILSLVEGGAAMHRFKLLPKASLILGNKQSQLIFLDQSGCAILEKWLRVNPDGSYPPLQVVELVLLILKQLPV